MYASSTYWDNRYLNKIQHEWYFNYDNLRHLISNFMVVSDGSVLEIGCGDKPLVEGISKSHPAFVLYGIDFSKAVINILVSSHAESNIKYLRMDARHLKFDSGTFNYVIDKGTIDAMLCTKSGWNNANMILRESIRVLKADGTFMLVSHLSAESIEMKSIINDILMPALSQKFPFKVNWKIDCHMISNNHDESGHCEGYAFASVYLITSTSRRFTRSTLNSGTADDNFQCPFRIFFHDIS